MTLSLVYKDTSIHSLVELGMHGHFPLFMEDWISSSAKQPKKSLTKKDRLKAKDIINRLNRHKGLERKKTVLTSLSDEDRAVFVRVFLEIVEHKIIDSRPGLH